MKRMPARCKWKHTGKCHVATDANPRFYLYITVGFCAACQKWLIDCLALHTAARTWIGARCGEQFLMRARSTTERGNNHDATSTVVSINGRRSLHSYKVLFVYTYIRAYGSRCVDLTFYTTSWLYYHIPRSAYVHAPHVGSMLRYVTLRDTHCASRYDDSQRRSNNLRAAVA